MESNEKKDYVTPEMIYTNMVTNSVGKNLSIPYMTEVKKSKLNVTVIALLLTFLTSCFNGCVLSEPNTFNNETEIQNDISAEIDEIILFQRQRVFELLEKYGFTNYETKGLFLNYNYTAEQYKTIPELDESYLYGFYLIATSQTVDEVCKALGYQNLNDFLITKGYINSKGEPNTQKWYFNNKKEIINLMQSQGLGGR